MTIAEILEKAKEELQQVLVAEVTELEIFWSEGTGIRVKMEIEE